MPSAPMRPPVITMRSPGRAAFSSPGRPATSTGKRADGATEHQRLAQVALVEELPAAAVGNAALVAAVDHALVHAVADSDAGGAGPGAAGPRGWARRSSSPRR